MYILMLSPSFGSLLKENGFDELVSWSSSLIENIIRSLSIGWVIKQPCVNKRKLKLPLSTIDMITITFF